MTIIPELEAREADVWLRWIMQYSRNQHTHSNDFIPDEFNSNVFGWNTGNEIAYCPVGKVCWGE